MSIVKEKFIDWINKSAYCLGLFKEGEDHVIPEDWIGSVEEEEDHD
jgi:hypothetical protein